MSNENDRPNQAVNPHTGQPVPQEPAAPRADAGALPPPPAGLAVGSEVAKDPASTDPPSETNVAAPTQQELAIRSALETVIDPEINLSIIDLGLVREVILSPGKTLIRMMLTTPFCPYAPQIIAETKQASMSVVPQETEVEIMPDAWSPDMMPDPGLLGFSY
jgi:metal-sulfur cluster biosynthetic enzyme